MTDRDLFDAYLREDMTVWKEYIDNLSTFHTALADRQNFQLSTLLYEYGYCGYIVAEAKKDGKESLLPEAKRYIFNLNCPRGTMRCICQPSMCMSCG